MESNETAYEGIVTRKRAALMGINNVAVTKTIKDPKTKIYVDKVFNNKENLLKDRKEFHDSSSEFEKIQKEHFVWPTCFEIEDKDSLVRLFQAVIKRKEIIRCHYTKEFNSEIPIWFPAISNDEFMHNEYLPIIIDHIIEMEEFYKPLGQNFLEGSIDVNYRHRYTLINWVVEIHESLSVSNESLQLSIAIMDRFIKLMKSSLKREDLLIIGIMSLFIAIKVEDVFSYSLSDILLETKINYDLVKCRLLEEKILSSLDFKLSMPLPLSFIRHYNFLFKTDTITNLYSRYFCELSLHDYIASGYSCNMIGSSCVFLAQVIQQHKADNFSEIWSPALQCSSGLFYEDFKDLVKNLCIIVSKQQTPSKYRAIATKYSSERYMKVAKCAVQTVGFKNMLVYFKSIQVSLK